MKTIHFTIAEWRFHANLPLNFDPHRGTMIPVVGIRRGANGFTDRIETKLPWGTIQKVTAG